MRLHRLVVSAFMSVFALSAYAGWQVATPDSRLPKEPFFQAQNQSDSSQQPSAYSGRAFPNQYARLGPGVPVYAASISGSLKQNLQRILGRYHWKVVWKAPYDYNFDGRVTAETLPKMVEKLVEPFPLQAVMYRANRTLIVTPRDKDKA